MEEPTGTNVPFKPGDPVKIVGEEAQAAVGADRGVVVGDTAGRVDADEVKVVVATDAPIPTNAVISPAELEKDSET
jgi:hypothetical protein